MTYRFIVGCGCDVVCISRIQRVYEKFGPGFLHRAYHPQEIATFDNLFKKSPKKTTTTATAAAVTTTCQQIEFLASRWAVKEAATKAVASHRIPFSHMLVAKTLPLDIDDSTCSDKLNLLVPFRPNAQRPLLEFTSDVQPVLQQLGVLHTHISLSHDDDYAFATVILEGEGQQN